MSLRSTTVSVLTAICVAGLVAPVPMAAASSDTIVVKTTTKRGRPVSAEIKMKKGSEAWSVLSAAADHSGAVRVTVDPCDSTVSFMAADSDGQGTYTREKPGTAISCTSPEVVFSDYVLALEAWVTSPDRITQSDAWVAAFGGDDLARAIGPEYARKFDEAFKTGDAGYVAIGAAEIAAALREAEKYQDARVFTALSIGASMAGIVDRIGADVDKNSLFVKQANDNGYALSSEGIEILKQYQMKNLGFTDNSDESGEIGWQTMKSLVSDGKEPVAEFAIPPEAIGKFDSKVFLQGG